VPKAPPPSLSKEQIGTIVAQADPSTEQGARDVALFQFLSETGARASEASAVTLGDIDLLARVQLCPRKGHDEEVADCLPNRRVFDWHVVSFAGDDAGYESAEESDHVEHNCLLGSQEFQSTTAEPE